MDIRTEMPPADLEEFRQHLIGTGSRELVPWEEQSLVPTILGSPLLSTLAVSLTSSSSISAFTLVARAWIKEKGETERLKLILLDKREARAVALEQPPMPDLRRSAQ